jgi:hypothetical protein
VVNEILLNGKIIQVNDFKERNVDGLHEISVEFHVTSEQYHAITTLLYEKTFDVNIMKMNVKFRGTIQQYSTSFTNLYKKDQVANFALTLREVKN